jgi:hypothetical protein
MTGQRPGPRPLPPEQITTSVRVLGRQQVDEFEALCHVLRRRPHQLAADLVLDGIRRYRDDPDVAPYVQQLVLALRLHRSGLRVVEGGAS